MSSIVARSSARISASGDDGQHGSKCTGSVSLRRGAAGLRERAGDLVGPALDARLVGALDHDARLALGAAVADQDAAVVAELASRCR